MQIQILKTTEKILLVSDERLQNLQVEIIDETKLKGKHGKLTHHGSKDRKYLYQT